MTVHVTAVVLTWNSARYVGDTLTSLRREAGRVPLEIVVVDNGSTDTSLEIVGRLAPDARIIRNRANLGVARARNQGARMARGALVLFLDSDAELTPGSLETMVRFAEANPRAAVVAPMLVSPDGTLQYSCRKFPTVQGKLLRRLPLPRRRGIAWAADEEMFTMDRSRPQPVDYAIGACQLVRRAVLEALGGLDERMFYGPEDVDFCLRAWRAGYEVWYLPEAVAVHREQRVTHHRLDRLALRHALALAYYFWKHRYIWRRPRIDREAGSDGEAGHDREAGRDRDRAPGGGPPAPVGRPRLLHLVTLSEWGGAQACVFALARGCGARYDVTVGCAPGGPLVSRLRAAGVRVVEIPSLVRDLSPLADLRTLWWLARWMRRERFAVVHCHSTKAGLLGRFAARLARVPGIVFTVHGWPFTGWWHPLFRSAVVFAERLAARVSTVIICVSEYDRRLALRMGIVPAEKLRVVHNGVDPNHWRAPPAPETSNRSCQVVSVGRLTQQKDPVTLLRAWRMVDGPHRLAVVGEGPMRDDLTAMIALDGLTGRVDLLGACEDVSAVLRAADLFVLASRWEGHPLAVLEAMMSGLPVVATAVGGVPEQVLEGETGFLVPPEDPEALARALRRLLDDPNLRRRMGAAGRRRALACFTEARMLSETERLYESAMTGTV